ncbi:MAG TPA: D-alanine--D-alanine ligase A, partial [Terriglobia bacterium]
MNRKPRLGILFGGRSAEHEVSLQSARNIIAAIDPERFDVIPIEISKDGRWRAGVLPPGSAATSLAAGVPSEGVEVIPAATPSAAGPLIPVPNSRFAESLGPLDVIFP